MGSRQRSAACRRCGHQLDRFWHHCPGCGKGLTWGDNRDVTGAECHACGWVVSKSFSHCPWCGANFSGEHSSRKPLKRPRGFLYHCRCDHDCGGGVQFPMDYCPWCGGQQSWPPYDYFEGVCPHCNGGVDDAMDFCVWCGGDATGQDLIRPAIDRVRELLRRARMPNWDYRVLVRPGVSGVDPDYPRIIELRRRYVQSDDVSWPSVVGLIAHELGHSFLFQHRRFARSSRFRRAFGDVDKPYRGVDESWVSFSRRSMPKTPTNHVTAYAATHPLEDFAETFRFYVIRRGRLRELMAELGRKRKGVVVYEKFLLLDRYIRKLRRKRE